MQNQNAAGLTFISQHDQYKNEFKFFSLNLFKHKRLIYFKHEHNNNVSAEIFKTQLLVYLVLIIVLRSVLFDQISY